MSNGPSEEPQSQGNKHSRRIWTTAGITLGAIAGLGAVGAAWWAWVFVNEDLPDWVSGQLSDTLDRPVYIGEVERISLTGVRFGESAIPPTDTDSDELFAESVEVRLNPLQLLTGEVSPRITLNGLRAFIEQNEAGEWLSLDFQDEDEEDTEPLIQVNPIIIIEESEVVLLPYGGEDETAVPLTLENIDGEIAIANVDTTDFGNQDSLIEAREIRIDIMAEPQNGGDLSASGVIRQPDYGDDAPPELQDAVDAQLAFQAQGLDLATLGPVVLASLPQDLPLEVVSGTLNGNLEVDLDPQVPPTITGTARVRNGALNVAALPNTVRDIEVQARFQGDRVVLEDFAADYGDLSATADGSIDFRNGYDLIGQIAPFEIAAAAEAFGVDLPVDADGTFEVENIQLTGPLANPNLSAELLSTDVVTIDQVQFEAIAAEVAYSSKQLTLSSFTVNPLAGGRLTGQGRYAFGDPARLSLQLEGQDLPADAIGRQYGLPDTFLIGPVALDADISGPLSDLSGLVTWNAPSGTYPTRGTAEIAANTVRVQNAEIAGGTVSGTGTLTQGQFTIDALAQGLQLGSFNESLAGVTAGGDVQLTGRTDNLNLRGIRGSGDITASLRGGTLDSQVTLANGIFDADVQTRNFPVRQFAPTVPVSSLSADARLSGDIGNLSLSAIQGDGTASAAIAGGTVSGDFVLDNGFFQVDGQGRNLQLRQIAANLQGVGDATFQLAGNLDNLSPTGVRGRANISLSEGLATAAGINPALARARAPLNAQIAWDGRQVRIDSLQTGGLFASGTVTPQLSGPGAPGIAAIDLGLSAQDYNLATLPFSLPPVVGVTGRASLDGRLTGTPSNLNFAGDLALANLALNDLVFDPLLTGDVNFSSQEGLNVALLGPEDEIVVDFDPAPRQLDFRIQASEAIAVGETEGDVLQARVYNFPISTLNIPPSTSRYGSLRGQVEFASAAINLDTFNTVGQLEVNNLGIGYYSIDRLFGGFAYADGTATFSNGEILMADRNARGEAIAVRSYDISGRYSFNQTPQLQASLATDEGQLRDVLEVLKIQELADLRRGFTPEDGFIPSSQAEAETLLATVPAGNPNGTLLSQLRRLSEILELEIQEELQVEQAALPPLSELEGSFSGTVDLTATIPEDILVEFDIEGDTWTWGPDFSSDEVLAQGSYRNGLITLEPLLFSSDLQGQPSYAALRGEVSLDPDDQVGRSMMLEVVNVPVDEVEDIANLPFDLDGRLNGTAMLAGRLADPDLRGEFRIEDGTLNDTPIDEAIAEISYDNARAGLNTRLLLIGSDDPLTLTASVPYQLPFVEAVAADQSYFIRANVRDEGFALLNLFTNRLAWESGEGRLILDLAGDFSEGFLPTRLNGLVTLDGAVISFSALPEPMTDVTGRIRLSPSNLAIIVENLTGQFSEGQLVAEGTFPLFDPLDITPEEQAIALQEEAADSESEVDAEAENPVEAAQDDDPLADPVEPAAPPRPMEPLAATPLSLRLSDIALNLKGLYNGQVDGLMVVGGSALLGPELTGEIALTDGTVTIPENAGNGNTTTVSTRAGSDNGEDSPIPPVRFSDLEIILSRNIRIVQGSFLNVTARGGLQLDGTLSNLRPVGTIRLPSGRVGLFSVFLRLAGSNDRAEFRGSFNPLLDVTLQTAIPDTPIGSGVDLTTSPFPRNEVTDNTIENIGLAQQGNRLVRITARYTGPASELSDLTTDSRNLELSSSPSRSDQEIVSLLSGNVIGALDALGGDSALTEIGTFLGSALLSNVRDFLGDTVPISEFRIFQVSDGTGGVNDSQEIGGEIGFDVTSNISVSVLKVLTNDTPFQFNTRYRLSDEFTLRGTTSYEDFSERSGLLLEYETRF